tara:strand:- start:3255 stop:3518 length:264 start_codon:yes stop_codon:yes gene_type:complete
MAKQSQLEIVLNHLNEFKTITSWEAIRKYSITRLSAIIHTLRHEKGLIINSTDKRNEDGKKWVLYRLEGVKDRQSSIWNSEAFDIFK